MRSSRSARPNVEVCAQSDGHRLGVAGVRQAHRVRHLRDWSYLLEGLHASEDANWGQTPWDRTLANADEVRAPNARDARDPSLLAARQEALLAARQEALLAARRDAGTMPPSRDFR